VDFVSQCFHSAGQVILTEIGIVKDDRYHFRGKIDLDIFDSIHGFQLNSMFCMTHFLPVSTDPSE
jgi:hypothetical protein